MANRIITVMDRQSIWDIAVQEYGSTEGVKQLIIDNPTKCNFETGLEIGMKLIISLPPINQKVYDFFKIKKINPSTAVEVEYEPMDWILTDGFWNDNNFWVDNALWIDN